MMQGIVALLLAFALPQVPGASNLGQGNFLPLDRTDRHSEPTRLVLKGGDFDTRVATPALGAAWTYPPEEAERHGYFYAQSSPQELSRLRAQVTALGGRVFDYVPHNALEVWLPEGRRSDLDSIAGAVIPVHPGWKVDPDIGGYGTLQESLDGRLRLSVEIWPDRDPIAVQEAVVEFGADWLQTVDSGRYVRLLILADPPLVPVLAAIPSVRWISEDAPATFRNDRSRWVIQTNQKNNLKVWLQGLTGANVTLGHMDGRIYEDSCFFDDPTGAIPGPTHRKIKWWDSPGPGERHGTHTAGSAAGDSRPVNNSIYRIGMAPDAWLVHHSYLPGTTNFLAMLLEANGHGARIHTNSWGNSFSTSYDERCRDLDAYSRDHEDAVVLFATNNGNNIKNPENAKSCLAVGATQRDHPERHGSGGKGPTSDGRLKPEVYAPGCSTWSAAVGSACLTLSDCGTSMACPVVAGACALVKQYFEDGFYPSGGAQASDAFTPSGSLLRAMMANSAVDMVAVAEYPSYREGWGRILLDRCLYFSGDKRQLWIQDKRHAQGLSQGGRHSYSVDVQNGHFLRITLAFADEPAAAGAADPVVNNLDLRVVDPQGTVYHGNILRVDQGGRSRPNPVKFDLNNSLEQVLIPAPVSGIWTVEVLAPDVPVGPQGYALVAAF
ncbi:MAG: hypothetical protein DWQ01_00110 [Planctomycetota bacterium]|nr:MAG: hypothetical protein DWQ01_00110 [Planctomycetota bacterium]